SLRLAAMFRRDVHQATAATMSTADSDGVFLRLQLPENEAIEYRHSEGGIGRTLTSGNRTIAREAFVFPPGIELSIRKDGSRLIVLTITSRHGEVLAADGSSEISEYAVPVSLHAVAALNRDNSYSARGAP